MLLNASKLIFGMGPIFIHRIFYNNQPIAASYFGFDQQVKNVPEAFEARGSEPEILI